MKRNSLLLFALILFIGLKNNSAQAPDWTRVLQFSTNGPHSVNAITADASSIYTAVSISSNTTFEGTNFTSVGLKDLLIIKSNYAGTISWMKQFNALAYGTIYANAIKTDASGNIYISGVLSGTTTIGNSTITSDATNNAFIAKFDTDGNGLWATAFSATGTGNSRLAIDASSNAYLISRSDKLLKFSSAGAKVWEQTYPDKTLQAIAINGSNLYLGGCLQAPNPTSFGTITLTPMPTDHTGFLVKSNLDGIYSNSTVLQGSLMDNSSTVCDIVIDNSGNLIITGDFLWDLVLGSINIGDMNYMTRAYTYIAKCDNAFNFSWAKASSKIDQNYPLLISNHRVFIDNSSNIYQYGISRNAFSYGSISYVGASTNQFLFKFDSNGDATNGYLLNNSSYNSTIVVPDGKVLIGSTYKENSSNYGNFYLAQYNNDLTANWEKGSSNNLTGTTSIKFIKHDSAGNMYLLSRVLGYCNYFGTLVNTNTTVSIISKHDIDGNLLWMNQISDFNPNSIGSSFTLDKDNNIITCGFFKTSLTIGTTTLTTSNTSYEGYAAKYSNAGDFLWAVKMNLGGNLNSCITVATDKDKNVIVTGVKSPSNFVVKLNADGGLLWAKTFPMGSSYTSQVSTDNENNIYLTSEIDITSTGSTTIGTVTLNQTGQDGGTVLVKFDPDGNAIWAKTYGGIEGSSWPTGWPVDIRTDATGNSYLWGWCENNAKFGTNTFTNPFAPNEKFSFYLAKINNTGDVVWANAVYEAKMGFNYGDLLDLDKNGNAYVGGHFKDKISLDGTNYTPVGLNDFFTMKFSNDGVFQWITTIPSDAGSIINALSVFDNDVLSISGVAGKSSTLGSTTINKKNGSNCIVATLGNLKYIRVSSNALSIASAANSTNTVNVTSNIDWSANSDQTWLIISSTSGSGDATLTLTAAANPLIITRTATLTISGNGVSDQTITVTQNAGEAVLSVSTSALTVAAAANSTNTFNITSNISWAVNSDQTWLTVNSTSGSNNATITVTAASNPIAVTRTANVTVSGANVTTKTVVVTQDPGTSGINDIEGLKAVNIFPNPSNGRFSISFNHYNNETIDVTISDALGNTIRNFSLNGLPENYTDEINLGNLSKGLYFVIVKTSKSKQVKTITITN